MKRNILFFPVCLILFIFLGCGKTDTVAPAFDAPGNLNIVKISEGRVRLTWTYSTQTTQINYVIARKEGTGNWDESYAQTQSDIREFIDEIPTNSYTVFSYKVKAVEIDSDYESYFSDPASFFPEITKPTELNINQISENELMISWKDNVIGEVGYKIDKQIENGNWISGYAVLPPNSENYIDTIDELYSEISYRVYAYVGETNSPYGEVSFTPGIESPEITSLEQLSQNQLRIDWVYSGSQHAGFEIDRMIGVSDWVNIIKVEKDVRNYIDTVQIDAGTVSYRVRAYTAEGLYSTYSLPAYIDLNIQMISSITLSQKGNSLFAHGNYVIIANDFNGVLIVDVSNQISPNVVTTIDIPGRALSVFVYDNVLYVTNHGSGLNIYDLTNINNPQFLHYVETVGNPYNVIVGEINQKRYAFIADGGGGLLTIDLHNSITGYPVIINRFNTHGISFKLHKDGNILYLADGPAGLKKIDISNPESPNLLSQKVNIGQVLDIKVKDNFLYLANANYGMRILDKNTLSEMTYYDTRGYTKNLSLSTSYAYIADREAGLHIVNILNYNNIFTISNIETESNANDVIIKDSYAYLLTDQQLYIIQINP